jgi:hypothetical protein
MFIRARTHDADAVSDALAFGGHAKMLLNREALTGPRSGGNQSELAAMKMHVGQPKCVKEVPDNLGVPIVAPPGLLKTDNAPRLAASSGNLENARQHGVKLLDVIRNFKSSAVTFSPF